jgi:hypothetical protein
MASLLGHPGEEPHCKVFTEDMSVHWFPRGATPGDACLCGQRTMSDEAEADQEVEIPPARPSEI